MSEHDSNSNPANAPRESRYESGSEASTVLLAEESTISADSSASQSENDDAGSSGYSSSRYLDYDTHELLERIAEYEDERRWQRIREGIWISILFHILLFSAFTWIPKYVFHQPQVIDPFDAIKQRKDLTFLDQLPDAVRQVEKARKVPPIKPNDAHVDSKTLQALRDLEKQRQAAQAAPKPVTPEPKPQEQASTVPPPIPAPQPPAPTVESPRPAQVPAKPNFSEAFKNPDALIQQALRNNARDMSQSVGPVAPAVGGGLNQHPGAAGGAEILSDTQGVDFGPYMQRVIHETYRTWDPLIPEEVNPPILKRGVVDIVFTILPNGRVAPHSMVLVGRSGDVALDRAAWGAIQGADYPPLPQEFHGPFLQLRFRFQYNVQ